MREKTILVAIFVLMTVACGGQGEMVESQKMADCGPGYQTVLEDGAVYCEKKFAFDCPEDYLVVVDGSLYSCQLREESNPDAGVEEVDAGVEETDAAVEQVENDLDQDGYSAEEGDCDDTRSDIHPGAEEVCDFVDNDCDGDVDISSTGESLRQTYYLDADEDGFGHPGMFLVNQCWPTDNFTATNGLDCEPARSDIYPGAEEVCGDEID